MICGYLRLEAYMEISKVKADIAKKHFDSLYTFIGEEWGVQKIYIEKISEASEMKLRYETSVIDVIQACSVKGLIKHDSFVYVVMDDNDYLKDEKLQEKVKGALKDNILILVYNKYDKRKKAFKDAVEFHHMKPDILKKYIKKEIKLSDENCAKLMDICEYDYGRCLLEIDKIKQYKKSRGINCDDAMNDLLSDKAIHVPPKDAIFDFVAAVMKRQNKRAFDLLAQSKAVGENTMTLLSVLYNNVKTVLAIQVCKGVNVAKSSGIDGRQIYYAKQNVGHYKINELINMMQIIQEMQEGIITGKIEEQFVMDYIMVNVL